MDAVKVDFSEQIGQYLGTVKQGIQRNLAQNKINTTGELSRSFEIVAKPASGVLSSFDYLEHTETGTPPGIPVEFYSLRAWVLLKLNVKDYVNERTGMLKKRIQNEGSLLYRTGGRRDIFTPILDNGRLIDNLANDLVEESENILLTIIDL